MVSVLHRHIKSGGVPNVASDAVLLYNRTASKAKALAEALGSTSVDSAAALMQQCTIVCMMLADDSACSSIIQELIGAGSLQGKVIVNHSTNTPDFAKLALQQIQAAGGAYLSAPVWGR